MNKEKDREIEIIIENDKVVAITTSTPLIPEHLNDSPSEYEKRLRDAMLKYLDMAKECVIDNYEWRKKEGKQRNF